MTNNENDIDIDAQEDFEKEPQQKASLKETWDSNPLLKIAAVILGIALLAGGYFAFIGEGEVENLSTVTQGSETKLTPGAEVTDPEYQKKVQEQNQERAQLAASGGGSSLPTPIGTSENQTLQLPQVPSAPSADPLAEWRAKTEARRIKMEQEVIPDERETEQPEIMPMVTPITPQPTMKMDPNASRMLAEQMRLILTSQEPKIATRMLVTTRESAFSRKLRKDDAERNKQRGATATGGAGTTTAGGASAGAAAGGEMKCGTEHCPIIVTAGAIAYAQLLNDLNSDVKGPALAQVLSGPFEGGRAIGSFQLQDEYLTLSFTKIVKDGVTYTIDGVAIDENTSLTGLQSDVDHHYFARVVLPAAADFIKGYASASAETGTTSTTTGSTVTQDQPKPDTKEIIMKGVETSAETLSEIIKEDSKEPITVKLWHGTTLGILFLDRVTMGDVE
jgi:hypothetical protein